MSDGYFARFVEHNDHEDEKWTFWLQWDGNGKAMVDLGKILKKMEVKADVYDFPYHLDLGEPVSEEKVDILVEYSDEGYMPAHNKVIGRLVIPTIYHEDDLYKGGIRRWFHD